MPRTTSPASPLRQAARDAQRGMLLDAAATLIRKNGVQGFSVREVAASVGASTMALYSLFGSKDDLLDAIFDSGLADLGARMRAAASMPAEAVARLWLLAGTYRRFAHEQPAVYRVVMHRLGQSPEYGHRLREGEAYAALASVVVEAVEAGQIIGDATVIADVLWAGVHGCVSLELTGYDADRPRAEHRFAQMGAALIGGLRPRAGPAGE